MAVLHNPLGGGNAPPPNAPAPAPEPEPRVWIDGVPPPAATPEPPAPAATPAATPPAPATSASEALWQVIAPAAVPALKSTIEDAIAIALDGRPRTTTVQCIIDGVSKPPVDVGITHPMYQRVLRFISLGINVRLPGPTGSGKTFLLHQLAKALGMGTFQYSTLTDGFQVVGYNNATGEYVETAASRYAAVTDKPCMLIFDEADTYDARAFCSANDLSSANRLPCADGIIRHAAPGSVCVMTMNTWGFGADSEYVGRNKMDAASLARYPGAVYIDYDEQFERSVVRAHAGVNNDTAAITVQKLRANMRAAKIKAIMSPRHTIAVGKLVAAGVALRDACDWTVLAGLDEGQRAIICQGVF